ncbi:MULTISPECIES: hypothetical protein [Micromonospora]|uniref:DUF4304 domain-containing protein n=1 Tax=Micromonospora solifontis TaxID=2487138 RepID=A0ABX9W8R1_9ACTN|nr:MULTISPECIES: hypothetical protein [Micromonospora]NES17075.1 hypothetical protein [Micromonospora sp. PPF5-17B]NES39562.1 hypothetical protein [Micromonospora solifontis]NES57081.1 hypothetical protein [Micromonospora sp. PPF5-6]RNL88164.1 hypothetical protein EFE23_26140 [Micromonospora solifontis]
MKTANKRRINDVVQRAVASAGQLGLKRVRQGIWAAEQGEVRWEIEALYESGYGDGIFRVGWGVLAPGAAHLIELEESDGINDATVGGDAGSLALKRRSMVMLCVQGAEVSLAHRLLWRARPEPDDVLISRISAWLSGPISELFDSLASRPQIVDFLENRDARYGRVPMHPEGRGQVLLTIAALKGLDGDLAGALDSLNHYRAYLGTSGDSYQILSAKVDRIEQRISRMGP